MKVILKESVDALGRRGEVVAVTDGYARNFLFPQQLALEATQENVRVIEAQRRSYIAREAKRIEEAKEIAAVIEKLQVTIPMKAKEDGQLYGSVTGRVVADALAAERVTIDPAMVRLENPIRELGVFTITIRLHPEVDTNARVWVVEERETA